MESIEITRTPEEEKFFVLGIRKELEASVESGENAEIFSDEAPLLLKALTVYETDAERELEHMKEFLVPRYKSKLESRKESVDRLDRLLREGKIHTDEFRVAQAWNTEITRDLYSLRSALAYRGWKDLLEVLDGE